MIHKKRKMLAGSQNVGLELLNTYMVSLKESKNYSKRFIHSSDNTSGSLGS